MTDEKADVMENLRKSLKEMADAFGLAAFTFQRRGGKGSAREAWYRDGARAACLHALENLETSKDVDGFLGFVHTRQAALRNSGSEHARSTKTRYVTRGAYHAYYLIEEAIVNYDGDVSAAHVKRPRKEAAV